MVKIDGTPGSMPRKQVEREANILQTLNYPRIIKVWDHCPGKPPDHGKYFIFMELGERRRALRPSGSR